MSKFILYIGLAAAGLTTFSFLPQAIKSIRTRHTKDLSLPTLVMLVAGIGLWLVYGLYVADAPLIAANSISFVIMVILLLIKIKFG